MHELTQQLGTLYTHTVPPTLSVVMTLTKNKSVDINTPGPHPLHVFNGVTLHAKVTSMVQQESLSNPFPTCTVEFVVFNLEEFTKDITNYCWANFSEQFNQQLDKVLEEE